MAEQQNGIQNKLGELFVEFGSKGMPSLLKNLNSVSAQFLLGKNAATQFADTLTKPLKEAGRTAVEVGKLANSLDTSYKNVQKLQYHLKKFNVGEGLINDLGNLQTTLRNVLTARENLPEQMADAFQNASLDLDNYSDDFEDILQFVKDLQNADLSRSMRNMALDFFGLSRDWGYLFDRSDFNLADALALPDDVIEKNIKTAENLQEFGLAIEKLKDLLIAEFLPPLTKFVEWFTGVTQDIIDGEKVADKISKGIEDNAGKVGVAATVVTGNPLVGATIVGAGNIAREQRTLGTTTGKMVVGQYGAAPMDWGVAPWAKNWNWNKKQGTATGGAAPAFMDAGVAGVPPNLGSMTQNINITNQNNINGTNATEIADKLAGITSDDIQYAQYQANHLTNL